MFRCVCMPSRRRFQSFLIISARGSRASEHALMTRKLCFATKTRASTRLMTASGWFSWVPPNVHGLKKKGEGAGIMVSGIRSDIEKAQDLRRERCRKARAAHAADDPTPPDEYRDIDMLHEEDGKFSIYYMFAYGKNKQGATGPGR